MVKLRTTSKNSFLARTAASRCSHRSKTKYIGRRNYIIVCEHCGTYHTAQSGVNKKVIGNHKLRSYIYFQVNTSIYI